MDMFEVGDKVKVLDGSYAVRVDRYEGANTCIGRSLAAFKVIGFPTTKNMVFDNGSEVIHDVFIENIENGKKYLHTQRFLRKVELPVVKDVTVSELEKLYGCTVRIVK